MYAHFVISMLSLASVPVLSHQRIPKELVCFPHRPYNILQPHDHSSRPISCRSEVHPSWDILLLRLFLRRVCVRLRDPYAHRLCDSNRLLGTLLRSCPVFSRANRCLGVSLKKNRYEVVCWVEVLVVLSIGSIESMRGCVRGLGMGIYARTDDAVGDG